MLRHFIYCSRLNKLPQKLLRAKWPFGSSVLQGRQFHKSPIIQSSVSKIDQLVDQGKKSILKLKSRDNVPNDYHLIYKGSMELTMRLTYPTFMFCAVGFLGLLIYTKLNKDSLGKPKSFTQNIKFLYPDYEFWLFSTALCFMTLAALSVMFKFPFRIYKHSKKREYIGIYLNPVPPMLKTFKFTSARPTTFKNPLYSFMGDCHYMLDGNKKSFLISQFFRVPKDLTDMFEEPRSNS